MKQHLAVAIGFTAALALCGCNSLPDQSTSRSDLASVQQTKITSPFDLSSGSSTDSYSASEPRSGDIQLLISQGDSAMRAGHWSDAAGWFKRAEILASSRNQKKLSAALWQSIGICYREAGQYDDAMQALRRAKVAFDHCGLGPMNPHTARVSEDMASVFILCNHNDNALRSLNDALEYYEGKWTGRRDGLEHIPACVDKIAKLCGQMNRPADGIYESTVAFLSKLPDDAAQRCQRQLVADWKAHIDSADRGLSANRFDAVISALGIAPPSPVAASDSSTSNVGNVQPVASTTSTTNLSNMQRMVMAPIRVPTMPGDYNNVTPGQEQSTTTGAVTIPDWFHRQYIEALPDGNS
jgi:hypothetical protein